MFKKRCIPLPAVILVLLFAIAAYAADMTPEQLIQDAKSQVKGVSIHDLKKMIDKGEDIIILDVRDKEEFEKGHIRGAINISRGTLEFLVQNKIPDKKSRIIVY